MKKLLFITISLLVCTAAQAQEKLFVTALNHGRAQDAFYVVQDPKGKAMKLKKLAEYAAEKDYLLGKPTYAPGKDDQVMTYPFLPKDEYIPYVYSNLREDSRDYSDLTNQGIAYCYLPDDQSKVNFWRCNQARWSGAVKDGYITGSGSGFVQVKNNVVIYFKGQFNNGLPVGEVKYKWYSIKTPRLFSKTGITTTTAQVGKLSEGMASFKDRNRYGFIDSQGLIVLPVQYKAVLSEFAGGKATVVDFDKKRSADTEIIIDAKGKIVDYTAKQKDIFAAEQRAKEEAARKALIAAREKQIADSLAEIKRQEEAKIAEQNRILEEQRKAEAEKALVEAKKNSEGRRIKWTETITFDTSGGGLGGLLTKAVGLGTTSYTVEYTAIVESVIAGTSVKAIITRAAIKDPNWASANYLKYKSYAREEAQKAIGQTRVKEFSEFDLVK